MPTKELFSAYAPPILGFKRSHQFLSNMYPAPFYWERASWATSEHAYQASKFTDPRISSTIRSLTSPYAAKKAARAYPLRPDWNAIRLPIMTSILTAKFNTKPLRDWLTDTFPQYIEETNQWGDTFWGVYKGQGHNHLGYILMNLRYQHIFGESYHA
jgi:ribA/ribD-fused uncharacterized protein